MSNNYLHHNKNIHPIRNVFALPEQLNISNNKTISCFQEHTYKTLMAPNPGGCALFFVSSLAALFRELSRPISHQGWLASRIQPTVKGYLNTWGDSVCWTDNVLLSYFFHYNQNNKCFFVRIFFFFNILDWFN